MPPGFPGSQFRLGPRFQPRPLNSVRRVFPGTASGTSQFGTEPSAGSSRSRPIPPYPRSDTAFAPPFEDASRRLMLHLCVRNRRLQHRDLSPDALAPARYCRSQCFARLATGPPRDGSTKVSVIFAPFSFPREPASGIIQSARCRFNSDHRRSPVHPRGHAAGRAADSRSQCLDRHRGRPPAGSRPRTCRARLRSGPAVCRPVALRCASRNLLENVAAHGVRATTPGLASPAGYRKAEA